MSKNEINTDIQDWVGTLKNIHQGLFTNGQMLLEKCDDNKDSSQCMGRL